MISCQPADCATDQLVWDIAAKYPDWIVWDIAAKYPDWIVWDIAAKYPDFGGVRTPPPARYTLQCYSAAVHHTGPAESTLG
jgi:hypothetical protein